MKAGWYAAQNRFKIPKFHNPLISKYLKRSGFFFSKLYSTTFYGLYKIWKCGNMIKRILKYGILKLFAESWIMIWNMASLPIPFRVKSHPVSLYFFFFLFSASKESKESINYCTHSTEWMVLMVFILTRYFFLTQSLLRHFCE